MELNDKMLSNYQLSEGQSYIDILKQITKEFNVTLHNLEAFSKCVVPSSSVFMALKYNKLPFSCYMLDLDDNFDSILDVLSSCATLTTLGGGIGVDFSRIRERGLNISDGYATSSGVMGAVKLLESFINYTSQNIHRRGAGCAYLSIDHPEIVNFINMRRITGDARLRVHDLHHAVKITDEFMEKVIADGTHNLISRVDGKVVDTISARTLFVDILLSARLDRGEPFIFFEDNVNRSMTADGVINPNTKVTMSNLCTEILIPTRNSQDIAELAVCCLASINLPGCSDNMYPDLYEDITLFFEGIFNYTERMGRSNNKLFARVKHMFQPALRHKNVGLGVCGYATLADNVGEPVATEFLNAVFKNFTIHAKTRLGLKTAIAPTTQTALVYNLTPALENYPFAHYASQDGTSALMETHVSNNLVPYQYETNNIDYMRRILSIPVQQATSCTLYYKDSDYNNDRDAFINKVVQEHLWAWKNGMKTLYYLRRYISDRGLIDIGDVCTDNACAN